MRKLFTIIMVTATFAACAAPQDGGNRGSQGGQQSGGGQQKSWSQGGQQGGGGQQKSWSGQRSGTWNQQSGKQWDGYQGDKWDGKWDRNYRWWNKSYRGYYGYPYYYQYDYPQYRTYYQYSQPYVQQYVSSDQQLSEAIRAALNDNFSGRFNYISIYVNNGNVILQGNVPQPQDRQAIEQTVRSINGVRFVDNQIVVQ